MGDLLMGVYLIIIAGVDYHYRGEYEVGGGRGGVRGGWGEGGECEVGGGGGGVRWVGVCEVGGVGGV